MRGAQSHKLLHLRSLAHRGASFDSGRRTSLLALLVGLLMLCHGSAQAQTPSASTRAQVSIILGYPDGTGIAPELQKIEALKKAPFDGFPRKALLKKVDLEIGVGSSKEVELPNGRKLKLSVLERSSGGQYRVSVSINKPGQQDYLPVMTVVAAPGDPFFVAGQKHEGGTLIIGVSVGNNPAAP